MGMRRRADSRLKLFGGGCRGRSREAELGRVCDFVQRRERGAVIVQMLSVCSSSQTGDPGLETSHLRLLPEQGNISLKNKLS